MLKHTILIFFTICFFTASLQAESVVFLKDNLKLALKKANSEGKLIFVDFFADYCTPCKIMDEHTFTQAEVCSKLASGYIPLKVNIESFDGYDLKNQYNVTVLPTMLILDAKGKLIARYEESMGGAALIKILDKYNLPEYKTHKNTNSVSYNKQTQFSNSAPFVSLGSMKPSSENAIYKAEDAPKVDAYTSRKLKPVKSFDQSEPSSEEFVERKSNTKYESPAVLQPDNSIKSYSNAPKPKHPVAHFSAPIKNNVNTAPPAKPRSYTNTAPGKTEPSLVSSNSPLKKISNEMDGYTIKIGAFSNELNAQKVADEAKKKYSSNNARIIVQKKMTPTGSINRVLVGKFASNEEATSFKNKFKIDGAVVSFQQLK